MIIHRATLRHEPSLANLSFATQKLTIRGMEPYIVTIICVGIVITCR